MDFGSLLHEAQKNGQANKNGGNYYKTKFEPPKKENKSTKLSANIQKFLAQKEKEEKQKVQEAKKQRDQLLSMRDVKATNKIKKMLKVIKSANKSVLEEAIDNNNTAVTMAGPDQPDEDDYGYVSQEASAAYSKMMEKYKSIPDEEKFSSSKKNVNHDLLSTKDRVRAAILRHQEEEAAPHRRKRKSRVPEEGGRQAPDFDDEPEKEEKKVEKPKPRRPAPPPLDFNQLLKIAEKKQFEPVPLEPKKVEKKSDEAERPMTKKQKREYEQLKAFREARAKREQERDREEELAEKEPHPPPVRKPKPELSNKPVNPLNIRIPKIGEKMKPPPEQKQSSVSTNNTSNKSLDKERSSSSKGSSEDRYKKEDSRSDRKSDFGKNSRPASSNSGSNSKMSERTSDSSRPQPSGASNSTKLKDALQRNSKNDVKSTAPDKRPSTSNPQRPPPTFSTPNGKIPSRPSPLPNNKSNPSKPMSRETPSNASKMRPDQRPQKDSRPTQPSNPRTDKKPEPQRTNIKPSTSDQSKVPNRGPPQKEQPKSFNAQGKRIPLPDTKLGKRPFPEDSRPSKQGSSSGSAITNSKQVKPSSEPQRGRAFPPEDVKKGPARQFPPADMRGAKQFPPRDMNPRKEKPRPVKKQLILDDDSEYDSELDDFIDDGPQDDGNDYSKHIKEIFGYDKSRYRDEDEDDRNMESNFSQVMREEYISKKIGIMEDLEDMRMEALEKKKKMQHKKRRIDDDD